LDEDKVVAQMKAPLRKTPRLVIPEKKSDKSSESKKVKVNVKEQTIPSTQNLNDSLSMI